MKPNEIHSFITILREEYKKWQTPAVTIVARCNGSPFKVLISCIISLRTKDDVTALASARLFALAQTPETVANIPADEIARLIYPAGFYRTKAEQIALLSRRLVDEYGSIVPGDMDELLNFKGVGRKTANLVMTLGFGKPGICVDTHVHRICNRLGYVTTKNPEETEKVLRGQLPAEYWIEINDLLVAFGQNHCHPVSPRCSNCSVAKICDRIGVKTSR
ncbi:MAG: endonuclease III [Desulfuromonadaceae bacterium]|nr:endonuclease III [Desulfuromonadaceae bacterium]MDD5107395.1 endonuclease III [Desulfuromonadaceae bacterium]